MTAPPFVIESGRAYALFVFDVAQLINLDRAAGLVRQDTQREVIRHQRRAPHYFEYRPAPLRLTQEVESKEITETHRLNPTVDLIVYEFGAVAVIYSIEVNGDISTLGDLSDRLYDNNDLLCDATDRVQGLLGMIANAVQSGSVAPFVEDYVIYHLRSIAGETQPANLVRAHRMRLAQILRSEGQALSPQELDDAVACQIAFGMTDLTIIDWQAAIIIDPGAADDIRAVLEFANVELLEMRFLDDQLDAILDRSYQALSRQTWRSRFLFHTTNREMRRLARLQIDSAIVFEEVNNALKLFGDQFLARVHRMALLRLHIPDWEGSIMRKLQTIESIYSKLSDYQSTRRMEILEWIIILLIAVSIAIAFLPGGH